MISSSFSPKLDHPLFQVPSATISHSGKFKDPSLLSQTKYPQIGFSKKPEIVGCAKDNTILCLDSMISVQTKRVLQKSLLPLAASVAIVLWSNPAEAGFLSGFSGLESIPGPELPPIEFLSRFNEENQKKYAEADAKFKESPILKQLLEQSKLNKEKNKQVIQDKYCVRGAEWGVGDCSAEGMKPEEREKFIAMLKEKAGIKD